MPEYPLAQIDDRFSSPGAEPVPWNEAVRALTDAGIYWLGTVRDSGRPHATPVAGVWLEEAFYFATGPGEQKVLNLARNPHCTISVGRPEFLSGFGVVLEGQAEREADAEILGRLASEFERKYNGFFRFSAEEESFGNGEGGIVLVYRVRPRKGFGFARGDVFSQTRWVLSG